MPIIRIEMLQGRSDEQKEALIKEVTDAVVKSIAAPPENITVSIAEFSKTNWGLGGVTAKKLGR
ncbi:2-hydroxymuconate tautomerase [Halioxenophilus aromaticivorans]|uniref:Tautomerase n=1 Tax=Halioxenophilus aromaticivorans TaxID=1306992 RepID=A0AAV3U5W8_9ALTE